MLCPGLLMSASALGLTPAPGDAAEISPTLQSLIAFCDDEYAIPVWMRRKHLAGIERRAAAADPMHVSEDAPGRVGAAGAVAFPRKTRCDFPCLSAAYTLPDTVQGSPALFSECEPDPEAGP